MAGGFFSCTVEGLERLRDPAVLVANHRSIFDICLLSAIVPAPYYFVSRSEVLKVPFIGSVLKQGGHVLIDRGKGVLNEPKLEEAAARAREGGRVIFFPEGTRSSDLEVRRFKSGAFRAAAKAGVPVVPVAIAGTELTIPKHSAYIISAHMAVHFLEPVTVDEAAARSEDLRERVRALVEERVRRIQSVTRQKV
jgi:1-acyl-sn-glycerol-3-phosphate acyltransferase